MPLPTKANVSRPKSWGYDGLLEYGSAAADSLYLRLAASSQVPVEIVDAELEVETLRTESAPEDYVAGYGDVYSRNDLSGGDGLDFLHRAEQRNPQLRYWDGRNVDPFEFKRRGDIYGVALHAKFAEERAGVVGGYFQTGGRVVSSSADYWYFPDGNNVIRAEDLDTLTPTFTSEDPHAGQTASTVFCVVSLGEVVYASINASGVHKKNGTWSHWSDQNVTQLWSAKERVIGAASGYELYELGSAATSTLLKTGSAPWGMVWDAGAVIAASSWDGRVYFFGPDASGNLEEVGNIEAIPGSQEYISAAVSYGDVVYFLTSTGLAETGRCGVYRAQVVEQSGLFSFANVQLLRDYTAISGATDAGGLRPVTMHLARDSVYYMIGGQGPGGSGRLERMYLPTEGIATVYDWDHDFANKAVGIIEVADRLNVLLSDGDLWQEQDTYPDTGWLIGPVADHYTADPKQWVEAILTGTDVPTTAQGGSLKLYGSNDPAALNDKDDSSWTLIATLDNEEEREQVQLDSVVGQYHLAKLEWTSSTDDTLTPVFRSYQFRSYTSPAAGPEVLVRIPVNVSDQVERRGFRRSRMRGYGNTVYDKLKDLRGDAVTLTLYDPSIQVQGILQRTETPVTIQGSVRGSATTVSWVTVRGVVI